MSRRERRIFTKEFRTQIVQYVNHDKLYGLGICAGGAYMIDAAKTEKRFNSIAAVSVNMGVAARDVEADKEALIATLTAATNQRTAELNGANVMLIDTVAKDDEVAIQFPEHSLFREARSYYRGVEEHPRSPGLLYFLV